MFDPPPVAGAGLEVTHDQLHASDTSIPDIRFQDWMSGFLEFGLHHDAFPNSSTEGHCGNWSSGNYTCNTKIPPNPMELSSQPLNEGPVPGGMTDPIISWYKLVQIGPGNALFGSPYALSEKGFAGPPRQTSRN